MSHVPPAPTLSPGPPPADDLVSLDVRQRLVRLALRLVWDRADAEDAVQEAMRLMLERRTESRGAAWLWRTVINLCLNQRRKRRPAPLPEWAVADAIDPCEALMQRERLERLRAAMEQLPQQQRVALTLRTMESLGYAEVAEIMQLAESAVRTHVHLARRALSERMGEP